MQNLHNYNNYDGDIRLDACKIKCVCVCVCVSVCASVHACVYVRPTRLCFVEKTFAHLADNRETRDLHTTLLAHTYGFLLVQ